MEDIFVFHIEKYPDLDGEHLVWYTWRMKELWMPASKLEVGQQIFAVGYPFIDDRYNYDEKSEYPSIDCYWHVKS